MVPKLISDSRCVIFRPRLWMDLFFWVQAAAWARAGCGFGWLRLRARAWDLSSPSSWKPGQSHGFQAKPGRHITTWDISLYRILKRDDSWTVVNCSTLWSRLRLVTAGYIRPTFLIPKNVSSPPQTSHQRSPSLVSLLIPITMTYSPGTTDNIIHCVQVTRESDPNNKKYLNKEREWRSGWADDY